ncbi:ribonuclease H-like domain-containing protein [Tanacetum coccineum]
MWKKLLPKPWWLLMELVLTRAIWQMMKSLQTWLLWFLDSEVHNDKTCSKTCLKSFETLKTQLGDLKKEFNKFEFNLATYKRGLAFVEEQLVFYKKNEVIFYEQLVVLKRDISYKDSEISMLKSELEKLKQEKESNQLKIKKIDNASKSLDKLIGSQITDKSRKGVGFVSYNVVPPPHTGLFLPPNLNLSYSGLEEFQQPEFEGYGPKTSKSVSEDISNEVRESPDAPLVEELVSDDKLEKKTVFPTVAKIEFVRPKQQEKPVRKPVKYAEMYRPKAVNTARPNSAVLNAVRANQVNVVKASSCWVRRPTKLNSALITLKRHNYVDARGRSKSVMAWTSRNLMEDMLPLGEEPKERKLLMCDKKNSVLFTDTGYFVLSPDFTLADESQVKHKIPRKNNMYSVDMNNIVPKESLSCLVAKATLDESMLWHRRLGKATQSLLFTWVFFLATKDETSGILKSFITEVENLVDKKVKIIRCVNGTEFKNRVMSEFCEQKGIKREFSVARTPQQNGVAERRNRTLIEAARTMVLVVKPHNKTPYELFRGKFDGKSDEGFFVGYSLNSKAFRVYNIRTRKVEENLHIRFLEDKPIIAGDGPKWLFDIDVLTKSMNYVPVVAGTNSNDSVDGSLFNYSLKNASNDEPQPSSDVGKKNEDNATLDATHADFFGDETEVDMSNITTTYLGLFMKGNHDGPSLLSVLLVSYPRKSQKGPWWIYHLAKIAPWYLMGDTGQEDERVARIEAIRLFLAYASFKDFVVYQMDVKSAFLHGKIEEEVQSVNSRKLCTDGGYVTFRGGAKGGKITSKRTLKTGDVKGRWDFYYPRQYPKDSPFELEAYSDSDYAGASLDRKSTTGGCQFLRSRLISWQCKKQTIVANSTTKA